MPKFVLQNNNIATGANTFQGTTTTSGALVASGGITGDVVGNVTGTVNAGAVTRTVAQSALVGATVVLTAADSGKLLINRSTSGSPSWTLPTAASGLYFSFTVASTSAGFTVTGGTIKAKTTATGTAISGTTLTNTQGTAVVGDSITLVCDGTNWVMVSQTGIFAAT